MKWDVVWFHGLDRFDISGVIHLEMDRGYVHPVSSVQAFPENIVETRLRPDIVLVSETAK